MAGFDRTRRRIFLLTIIIGLVILFTNFSVLTGTDVKSKIQEIDIPLLGKPDTDTSPGQTAPPDPNVRIPLAISKCYQSNLC